MSVRVFAALLLLLLLGCLGAAPAPAPAAIVWAVGDGGVPEPHDEAVAGRIGAEGIDRLLYLGDVYEHGTAEEFQRNYGPSFGRFHGLTSPTPGNHEWANRATGYDPYWGSRAPRTAGGHAYAFELDGWRFISLNSEEDTGPASPQAAWLRGEIVRRPGDCTIAFVHKPRYSAGPGEKSRERLEPLWAALAGRSVAVLSGHDHNYQRLRPERGITQFVVGTGGRGLYQTDEGDPRLVAVDDRTFGALRLDVEPGRAQFAFVTTDGRRLDSGTLTCSSPSPPATAPRVRITAPRGGARHSRRLRVLRGTASLSAQDAVQVTLTRRRGRACRAYDGRRFAASCRRPPLVTPSGTRAWRLRLGSAPRAGRYRLTGRVRGSAGVLDRHTVAFRVD